MYNKHVPDEKTECCSFVFGGARWPLPGMCTHQTLFIRQTIERKLQILFSPCLNQPIQKPLPLKLDFDFTDETSETSETKPLPLPKPSPETTLTFWLPCTPHHPRGGLAISHQANLRAKRIKLAETYRTCAVLVSSFHKSCGPLTITIYSPELVPSSYIDA